jgi:hypothetical protein
MRLALSDAAGQATLHRYSSSGNNSLWSRDLAPGHPARLVGTEDVPLAVLDELVDDGTLEPPALVKIDVEGHELAVLRGARKTLAAHRPAVVLEYDEAASRDAGHPREALVEELERHGYEVHGVPEDPMALRVVPLGGDVPVGNLLALPPGRRPPGPEVLAAAAAARPELTAVQRFQALYLQRFGTGA